MGCHLGFMNLIVLTNFCGIQEATKTLCYRDSIERDANRYSGCAWPEKHPHGWRRCRRYFWGRCSNWRPDAHAVDSDSSEVLDLLNYYQFKEMCLFLNSMSFAINPIFLRPFCSICSLLYFCTGFFIDLNWNGLSHIFSPCVLRQWVGIIERSTVQQRACIHWRGARSPLLEGSSSSDHYLTRVAGKPWFAL